ncbi:MAG TPA: GAF domain-containing protein, partial [Polyangiaceae bacterium]
APVTPPAATPFAAHASAPPAPQALANNPFLAPVDPFAAPAAPLPIGVPVPATGAPAPPAPTPFTAPAAIARRPSDSFRTAALRGSSPRHPTPSRPSYRQTVGRRATGDELIANLFEAMHELQFARDVIEGGDYVLALALEMIPSRAGIVHLYDIDRREYVVACTSGQGVEALLNRRHSEGEPLLAAAMRKRRAIVASDANADENVRTAERFGVVGGATSAIVSPVMQGGRFIGVIEVVNPLDGTPFTEDEGNAIDYISEQFGEFVSNHGMMLDPARITRSQPPSV